MRPCPTPSAEAPGGVVCLSIKTLPLEGKTAHHGGDVCELCVLLAKSLPSEIFHSRQNVLSCKAVNCIYISFKILDQFFEFRISKSISNKYHNFLIHSASKLGELISQLLPMQSTLFLTLNHRSPNELWDRIKK
jgi:hypothetical protein